MFILYMRETVVTSKTMASENGTDSPHIAILYCNCLLLYAYVCVDSKSKAWTMESHSFEYP
jgi:hypothetical protein